MKVIRFALILLVITLSVVQEIHACMCDTPPPPCYEYWKMDAVFLGTVSKVHGDPNFPIGTIDDKVEVKVDKNYHGMDFLTATTINAGHSCAFHFKEGEKFLFYAGVSKIDKRDFGVNFCTRTARYDENLIDFEFLNKLNSSEPAYWIWATVSNAGRYAGVAGVKAEVIGNKSVLAGVSDKNGNLMIAVPAAGSYKVRMFLPKGMSHSGMLRNDRSLWEEQQNIIVKGGKVKGKGRFLDYKVSVMPNKCAWIDLSLMNSE